MTGRLEPGVRRDDRRKFCPLRASKRSIRG
jgi:hypothetical protein